MAKKRVKDPVAVLRENGTNGDNCDVSTSNPPRERIAAAVHFMCGPAARVRRRGR